MPAVGEALASRTSGSHRTPTWVPSGIFFAPLFATGRTSSVRRVAIGSERTLTWPKVRPSDTSDGVTGTCGRIEATAEVPVAPSRTWVELTPFDTRDRWKPLLERSGSSRSEKPSDRSLDSVIVWPLLLGEDRQICSIESWLRSSDRT